MKKKAVPALKEASPFSFPALFLSSSFSQFIFPAKFDLLVLLSLALVQLYPHEAVANLLGVNALRVLVSVHAGPEVAAPAAPAAVGPHLSAAPDRLVRLVQAAELGQAESGLVAEVGPTEDQSDIAGEMLKVLEALTLSFFNLEHNSRIKFEI